MPMNLQTQLEQMKYRLSPTLSSLDEALELAHTVLTDSHRHDINEAIDVYHNTLIKHVQELIKNHEIHVQDLHH